MSIEGKHAYRFEYLKSEKWQTVRLEALAREGGHCEVCGSESIHNDAHHVWYPTSVWDTTEEHLVILCRPCHELLHALIPESKTSDEGIGREAWIRFRNAIQSWQMKKRDVEFPVPNKAKELREAYAKVKSQLADLQKGARYESLYSSATTEQQLSVVVSLVKGWAKSAMKNSSCGEKE